MIVIGIDPGLTGAIAIIGHRGEYCGVMPLPTMPRHANGHVKNQINGNALAVYLQEVTTEFDKNEVHVYMETPIAFPNQHVSSTAATFLTAGIIEGVLMAKHWRHTLVSPSEWKKGLKMKAKSDKEASRAAAIRLFPQAPLSHKNDHNKAEALLIARYGWEQVA